MTITDWIPITILFLGSTAIWGMLARGFRKNEKI